MFDAAKSLCTVTFDQALQARALDAGNWSVRVAGQWYTIVSATASGAAVELQCLASAGPGGPNGVSYAPPPFDVLSTDGVAAEVFSDFPLS